MSGNLQMVVLFILFIILELCSSCFGAVFQYNRTAVIDHWQFWRLLTAHFTHWNYEHLFWDASAFLIASFLLLRFSVLQFCIMLLFSLVFISVWILIFNPDVNLYRGLSGVDVSLFFFLSLSIMLFSWKKRRRTGVIAGIIFLSLLIMKAGYEFFSGEMLFVRNLPGRRVLLSAHLAGAFAGTVSFIFLHLVHLEKSDRHGTSSELTE